MRRKQDPKVARIEAIALFKGCSRDEIGELANLFDECTSRPGDTLVSEGGVGLQFFVIEQGSADVFIGDNIVATLGPGDFFGETALLDHLPRTGTVKARTEMVVLVATARNFDTLIKRFGPVAHAMMARLASRIRQDGERVG